MNTTLTKSVHYYTGWIDISESSTTLNHYRLQYTAYSTVSTQNAAIYHLPSEDCEMFEQES